jgi:peroxiredoxin
MSDLSTPPLDRGQIIPTFTLPGADGMPHSPWDYKQRDHLVLLFPSRSTTTEGRGLLRAFAHAYAQFREEQCALLAVTAETVLTILESQASLHLPYTLLADPNGTVLTRYTTWNATTHLVTPTLVLTDRYGAFYERWQATTEAELPAVDTLLDVLSYLNRLCTP